jgi:signal transduction histidine kinase/PAS domain-containing protein
MDSNSTTPLRILLVEDDEHDWLAFRRAFQKSQVRGEITRYVRAEEALERLGADTASFDLVVTDHKLPGMTGLELCRELLDREVPLPLVLLTGAGTEHLAVEALKTGIDDYMIKDPDRGYLDLLPLVLPDAVQKHKDRLARRQAEEALQESEERYRILFENAPVSLWVEDFSDVKKYIESLQSSGIKDLRTYFENHPEAVVDCARLVKVVDVNRSTLEMYQAASKEELLAGLGKVLTEESYDAFKEQLVAIANGETRLETETVNRTLTDERRHVVLRWFVAPGYVETLSKVFLSITDITARVRATETLHQRNRELALLNHVGQKLTATLDLQQVAEQSLQAVTETIGAEDASVWLWDGEEKDWLVCQAAFHQGQSRPPVSLRLRSGQGIAGWVALKGQSVVITNAPDDPRFFPGIDEQTGFHTTSLIAVPLRVRDTVVGVLEVVNKQHGDFDTDDLALIETLVASVAIATDNARLVEALWRRTAELEARNEDLDAFAHTVAHDLKNPLGVITGLAGVLKEDCASLSGEALRHYLGTIVQNARKINSIIDELLLLAVVRKLEEVEMRPLDMASIVAETQRRLAHMIGEHQAEITSPGTWPVARGYGPWVEEVWVNYLSNAIKYGGQPPRVELGATEQASGTVRFWVRDNGPGIPPEAQARLFTPFTQLGHVPAKGHGLGLSIAGRIVRKLDGQVGVESKTGVGSTFWFTLPAP